MQSVRRFAVVLVLSTTLTGCAGGLVELPILSTAGQAAIMGGGAVLLGQKYLGNGARSPATAGQPAVGLPEGVKGVLILPGTKADIHIKAE